MPPLLYLRGVAWVLTPADARPFFLDGHIHTAFGFYFRCFCPEIPTWISGLANSFIISGAELQVAKSRANLPLSLWGRVAADPELIFHGSLTASLDRGQISRDRMPAGF